MPRESFRFDPPHQIPSQMPDFKMFQWIMYKWSSKCALALLENLLNIFKKKIKNSMEMLQINNELASANYLQKNVGVQSTAHSTEIYLEVCKLKY